MAFGGHSFPLANFFNRQPVKILPEIWKIDAKVKTTSRAIRIVAIGHFFVGGKICPLAKSAAAVGAKHFEFAILGIGAVPYRPDVVSRRPRRIIHHPLRHLHVAALDCCEVVGVHCWRDANRVVAWLKNNPVHHVARLRIADFAGNGRPPRIAFLGKIWSVSHRNASLLHGGIQQFCRRALPTHGVIDPNFVQLRGDSALVDAKHDAPYHLAVFGQFAVKQIIRVVVGVLRPR